jgi:hypothetical protein
MTYNINPNSYNPNFFREVTETNHGDSDPRIKKYIDASFSYKGNKCTIKTFTGESVWVDRITPSGRIFNFAIHQDEVLTIIEAYESKVEAERAKTAQNFASEFEQYRQSRKSA